jgi:hypothetical protein
MRALLVLLACGALSFMPAPRFVARRQSAIVLSVHTTPMVISTSWKPRTKLGVSVSDQACPSASIAGCASATPPPTTATPRSIRKGKSRPPASGEISSWRTASSSIDLSSVMPVYLPGIIEPARMLL